MSAPRNPSQPITASVVVVNRKKSPQEITLYNLLYHRVSSMLPGVAIEHIKKIVTGQIKAWKRLNKEKYKALLQQVKLLQPEEVTLVLRDDADFGKMFDDAASQIAEMTRDVLNYALPAQLTHQYLLQKIHESRREVHRLQRVVRIDENHPLRTYLDSQDAYLLSISSTMFVVIGAINRFLTSQEGDHSYNQSSDILIRLVKHVSGTKIPKNFNEKFYNRVIQAILPDVVTGSLTDEQSNFLKTAVKAVLQLVKDQNTAIDCFTKLSGEHKTAATRAGIVTKPVTELAMSIVYDPKDFVYFAAQQYAKPLFEAAGAAKGGARVVRDFFYNVARPLYGINIGFKSSNTADELIRKVYGQSLSQNEFYTLYDFHVFVVSVLGDNAVPLQSQVEKLFAIYIKHNPTNEAINAAHYNFAAMVSLWERHPNELKDYVSLYQREPEINRDQLLVKLMLDLNGIQLSFANGGIPSGLISYRLSQIVQVEAEISKLIGTYITAGKGEQARLLQNFRNNVIIPKLQLILFDLYKSILPDICRDIMDVVPSMADDDNARYQKLNEIFNKALSGSALVSVEEIEWVQAEYVDLADKIIEHKISMLPAAIKVDKLQYDDEVKRIRNDVSVGIPAIFKQCDRLSGFFLPASFATNPNIVVAPIQLRSRKEDEVNNIKEMLNFVHPNFVFQSLLVIINRQIDECRQYEEDPEFKAQIKYCEALKKLLEDFLNSYCVGEPVDYSTLAQGIQQLIHTAVATTDEVYADTLKKLKPSLGFLFKVADSFSPANGVGDRNYMDLAVAFLLKHMELGNVQETYAAFQKTNSSPSNLPLLSFIHRAKLANPLGTTSVLEGVVSGYVGRMADYFMSLSEDERIRLIGYIPGMTPLMRVWGDLVFNRANITKLIMEMLGLKEKEHVLSDSAKDRTTAETYLSKFVYEQKYNVKAGEDDNEYQFFEATLNDAGINFDVAFAGSALKKIFDMLESRVDEEFVRQRAVFFEAMIIYLTFLFEESAKLQAEKPIEAMKSRDLILFYLDKLGSLAYLTKSQKDTIQATRNNLAEKVSTDVDKKIEEINAQLTAVNQELGKAEADHGVVRDGKEPARTNYFNIGLHVAGGVFEIGSAAYAVYATVIALLPLIGTAATLGSFATAFVGGPLAMIGLRFVFYTAKGLWEDREKFREIWRTKEGEEPKKGLARVGDIALKVGKTAALVAKNVGLAVLKATLVYHVVNYVSTIKALDVRNWVVFKAIKKRVQRRKVDDQSVELKALARHVNTQAKAFVAANQNVDTRSQDILKLTANAAKVQFFELQMKLEELYAKVKDALPVVQATLKPQIDSLKLLQAQLEAVYRTRQFILQSTPAAVAPAQVQPVQAKPAHMDLQAFLRNAEEKQHAEIYTNQSPLPPEPIVERRVLDAVATGATDAANVVKDVVTGAAGVVADRATKAAGGVAGGVQNMFTFFNPNPGNVPLQLPQPAAPSVSPSQPDVPRSPVQAEVVAPSAQAEPSDSVSDLEIFSPTFVTAEDLAKRPADPEAVKHNHRIYPK